VAVLRRRLEALHSARSAGAYEQLDADLAAFHQLRIDGERSDG
jgi:sigma54-dependent transcription regulator